MQAGSAVRIFPVYKYDVVEANAAMLAPAVVDIVTLTANAHRKSPSLVSAKGKKSIMANLNQSITSVTSVIRAPFEPTVLRNRSSPKGRVSIQMAMDSFDANMRPSTGSSGSTRSNTGGSAFSTGANDSTRKTSVNSDFFKELTGSSEKKKGPRRCPARSSPPEAYLGTIEETGLEKATIITVERAAAAKIYLETYYNELLARPHPRTLRRRAMEYDLWCSRKLTMAQKDAARREFYEEERWSLRETRVLRWRSSRASRGEGPGPFLDDFEVVKVLGKGSFGVVRLVRERERGFDGARYCQRQQVYAMKVIRKSDNLRGSQEGHLRAERDFLVASENSDWYVPPAP